MRGRAVAQVLCLVGHQTLQVPRPMPRHPPYGSIYIYIWIHIQYIWINRLNYWGDLNHHADTPNQEFVQYGGNELPWPRRSALSEYSCYMMVP